MGGQETEMLKCDEALKKAGLPSDFGSRHCIDCHNEDARGEYNAGNRVEIEGEYLKVCCRVAEAIHRKQAKDIILEKCRRANEEAEKPKPTPRAYNLALAVRKFINEENRHRIVASQKELERRNEAMDKIERALADYAKILSEPFASRLRP
jgi:hypothetical protein